MGEHHFPLVSVLLIFCNQEKFVAATFDSVLAQDYPFMEIIAADDASTDNTPGIIVNYAAKHPNIKPLLSKERGGITQNCNNALQAATGKFLIVFGGDDLMVPGRITRQVAYFQQHPATAVCCTDIDVFFDDEPQKNYVYRNKVFYKKRGAASIIAQDNMPPTSAMMFDWEKCSGIRFDSRTPIVSDWLFVVECSIRGATGYVNGIYTRYRRHSNNITAYGVEKAYIEDRLIYTDILISRYPQFRWAYKKQRCHIFYNVAKRLFWAANFKVCRNRLGAAMLEWPFSVRVVAMYGASFIGKPVLRWIKKRQNR